MEPPQRGSTGLCDRAIFLQPATMTTRDPHRTVVVKGRAWCTRCSGWAAPVSTAPRRPRVQNESVQQARRSRAVKVRAWPRAAGGANEPLKRESWGCRLRPRGSTKNYDSFHLQPSSTGRRSVREVGVVRNDKAMSNELPGACAPDRPRRLHLGRAPAGGRGISVLTQSGVFR